jgi:hypothetical protein
MTSPDMPICPGCRRPLDRISRVSIENLILDEGVFRPVNIAEALPGETVGVASSGRLCCGYCETELGLSARKFFYQRWWEVLKATGKL